MLRSQKDRNPADILAFFSEKGRLSAEEIERMIRESEEYADEDAAIKRKIEALNSLQNILYSMETTVKDKEGAGGKISESDKQTILDAIKQKRDWVDDNGQEASAEDFEDQLAEFQSLTNPIISGLYGQAGGEQETYGSHDEL